MYKREDGHGSGIPTVHGLVTNLALHIASLLKRQTCRHHLIFSPAIGALEEGHRFYKASSVDDVEFRYRTSPLERTWPPRKSILEEGSQYFRPAWVLELTQRFGLDLSNPLARYRKLSADFLQRMVAVHAKTKAHAHDSLFTCC